ncbi:alpha/beta hydrolase [Kitasatospora sp. NPDC096147]|uniref:alpha/beta hydrolase n=1 Tax=Kitasatospora sp. NPDC096147 TaxID=3364093 RepID=UPI003826362D
MKLRTALPALAAALLLTPLLTGCGSTGGSGTAAPKPSASDYGCLARDRADRGSFALDSVAARDAYHQDSDAGHAKVAVVLSHENGGSLCDWVPFVEDFTRAGYGALAFTSAGDVALDVEAAEKYLKGKGVERVVLIGASKGGTASLAAAATPGALPVAAVVTLSSPTYHGSWDGKAAIGKLTVPLFLAVQESDQPFAENAAELAAAATAAPVKELKVYQGTSHGVRLLEQGTAKADLLAFLAKNAPAG